MKLTQHWQSTILPCKVKNFNKYESQILDIYIYTYNKSGRTDTFPNKRILSFKERKHKVPTPQVQAAHTERKDGMGGGKRGI